MKKQGSRFTGFFWGPTAEEQSFTTQVTAIHPTTSITAYENHNIIPPTSFQTTELTAIQQQLVDTYGICRYKELNPAIVSMVTFPFLFGMMFGDVGHGSLLLLAGIYLTLKSDDLKRNGQASLAAARYALLLLGLFACYCGFVYNEFFAMPLNMFNSCYQTDEQGQFLKVQHQPW